MSSPGLQDDFSSVLKFLKKMGYKQTEQALRDETKGMGIEAAIFEMQYEGQGNLSSFFLHSMNSSEPSKGLSVMEQYQTLLNWIHESLDSFRDDLGLVLYPIFLHAYLDLLGKNLISEGYLCLSNF
jgi:transcription initiation factor TFIID subunit 5